MNRSTALEEQPAPATSPAPPSPVLSGTNANVASHLPAVARVDPDRMAVICAAGSGGPARLTYRQLDHESDRLARGLIAAGIGRGERVALMVRPGLDFFALTFALFKAGVVLIAVDPGIGLRRLGRCLAEAEPNAFIGGALSHLARRGLGWGGPSLRASIITGRSWPGLADTSLDAIRRRGAGREPLPLLDTRPGDLAAILFTSGSTGPPKGAAYTHANFDAQVRALRATYAIAPGEIDLATFPLFGLFAPALGMTAVVPEMDFTRPGRVDARRLARTIEAHGATNLFGSPALLARMAEWGAATRLALPTLRRVISAGAPVPAATLATFARLLAPGVQVFTPYGATEALPVCSIGSDEILGETRAATEAGAGVCVGRPVAGVRLRIIEITDAPLASWSDARELPAGETGEIVVQGPMVTARYYNRPEADALAKIPDPEGGSYHRMGDLGYLDPAGRLWMCGRKSERVATSGGTLYTVPCEAIFNSHPRVARTALVGVRRPGGTTPALCVELAAPASRRERKRIRRELVDIGAAHPETRGITDILFHPRFPVDVRHNAKIGRAALAGWAAEKLPSRRS